MEGLEAGLSLSCKEEGGTEALEMGERSAG